jgi:hypothetical protein
LSDLVIRLRAVRQQLQARNDLLKDQSKTEALVKTSVETLGKLEALEGDLHNAKAEVAYDILAQKGGAKLYSRLILLYEFARDGDGAPTQGMREVHEELRREWAELAARWQSFLSSDLAKLNQTAKELDVASVIVPEPVTTGKK